jgi:uncharacterized LabA/DUF88 family protein
VWKSSFLSGIPPEAQLWRVHWYQIGSMDGINVADAKFQAVMKERYDDDKDLKRVYMAIAGKAHPEKTQEEVALDAWNLCFSESRDWYAAKQGALRKMREFNFAIRASTDFVDINENGHWKVDFLNRHVTEKGLDTSLAVDMVTMVENYEVAILVSGDADAIPSVHYLKQKGKHVGVLDFIKGHPPEKKGRQTSTRLQNAVDFVVPLYETDLLKKKLVEPYAHA